MQGSASSSRSTQRLAFVIAGSGIGTVIEWYDFFVYASLTPIIAKYFFPSSDYIASILSTFATFAVGYLFRPVGAFIFGRMGDKIGRKMTFIFTLLLMSIGTTLMGVLPVYQSVGVLATALLVLLRIFQGTSVGGEWGGASTYVMEFTSDDKRGFLGSIIPSMATWGLILSLVGVLGTNALVGDTAFNVWGWRLPFLYSAILLVIGLVLRLRLKETLMYQTLKEVGKTSNAPISEIFRNKHWIKLVFLTALIPTIGSTVVWYTAHFYILAYLENFLKVSIPTASAAVGIGATLAALCFPLAGKLSDIIGRKITMFIGNIVFAIIVLPIFYALVMFSNPPNVPILAALTFVLILQAAFTYGPSSAFYAELFPTRIRYSATSITYHIGVGIFGGFTPLVITAVYALSHNIYIALLAYPVIIPLFTAFFILFAVPETKNVKLWKEVSVGSNVRTPYIITPETSLREAIKGLESHDVLIISRNGKTPIGVVTYKEVLKAYLSNLPMNVKVGEIMNSNISTIQADESVLIARNKMLKEKLDYLIALKDKEVVGYLSSKDLEESLLSVLAGNRELRKISVKKVMRPLELVNPVTTVREASQIVGEKEILAIAEGEKVTGILGEREIIKAMSKGVDKESSIINIASEEYLLINNPNTSLAEVAKLMAQRRVSYCIVCSEGGKPLGIITTRDVISGIS